MPSVSTQLSCKRLWTKYEWNKLVQKYTETNNPLYQWVKSHNTTISATSNHFSKMSIKTVNTAANTQTCRMLICVSANQLKVEPDSMPYWLVESSTQAPGDRRDVRQAFCVKHCISTLVPSSHLDSSSVLLFISVLSQHTGSDSFVKGKHSVGLVVVSLHCFHVSLETMNILVRFISQIEVGVDKFYFVPCVIKVSVNVTKIICNEMCSSCSLLTVYLVGIEPGPV